MYSSQLPSTAGVTQAPLSYGVREITYRVWHFGHSTQCRARDIKPFESTDFHGSVFIELLIPGGRTQYPLDDLST